MCSDHIRAHANDACSAGYAEGRRPSAPPATTSSIAANLGVASRSREAISAKMPTLLRQSAPGRGCGFRPEFRAPSRRVFLWDPREASRHASHPERRDIVAASHRDKYVRLLRTSGVSFLVEAPVTSAWRTSVTPCTRIAAVEKVTAVSGSACRQVDWATAF